MGVRELVTLSESHIKFCEEFRKPIVNGWTGRGVSEEEQVASKQAELAWGLYLRMNKSDLVRLMRLPLDYELLTPNGLKGDTKSSLHPRGTTLFWPVNKVAKFDNSIFDFLAFANTHRSPVIELHGWLFKQEFRQHKLVADDNHWLAKGTWYWGGDLRPPEDLFTTLTRERLGVI